jgi:hypothetical protein
MMLAAGRRQVHKDVSGNKIVKFDQGIYKVPKKARIEKEDGHEVVDCEAYGDADDDSKNYAIIGGVRVPLAIEPDLPMD